jgi:hypothetical protein
MRWAALLLLLGCSKPMPPPPPLAVPRENASGPAELPDAGESADGGTDTSVSARDR